jgi:hypothetical protein
VAVRILRRPGQGVNSNKIKRVFNANTRSNYFPLIRGDLAPRWLTSFFSLRPSWLSFSLPLVEYLLKDLIPGTLESCMPLFLVAAHCYTQDIEVRGATCQQKNADVLIMISVRDMVNEPWKFSAPDILDTRGFHGAVFPLFS